MMTEKTKMIAIVDDRLWKSVLSDITTVSSLFFIVGMGLVLDSSALQWIGALMWIVWCIARMSKTTRESRMTIQQAREFIDALERGE
jgi:hypothetical protein